MTVESAYCERIGRECDLKRQAIVGRDMHTLVGDTLVQHNASFVSFFGRVAKAFSKILPFVTPIEDIPAEGVKARGARYDQHIAQPCEGDECVMTKGLEKL